MAGVKLTQAERDRILSLHGEGWSRNGIARELGRSAGVVSKVVHDAGGDFERTGEVIAAVAAVQLDNAGKRAELQRLLLEDAMRIREQLWQPCVVYNFGGKDNTYEERELSEPDAGGKATLLRAVGIAVDKSLKLAEADTDSGADKARGLLGQLFDGLVVLNMAQQQTDDGGVAA